MARPREFDEEAVLDAAVQCFWTQGYGATSVKDLIDNTGLSSASLYNAYGDKLAIFQSAFTHYVEKSIGGRIGHCEALAPRDAITAFFHDILRRSLSDRDRKGCLVVNSALELAPHDPVVRQAVTESLRRIELFFQACIKKGQADGTIARSQPADAMAQHLLGLLMGVRVLARVRPERSLLEAIVWTALATLDPR